MGFQKNEWVEVDGEVAQFREQKGDQMMLYSMKRGMFWAPASKVKRPPDPFQNAPQYAVGRAVQVRFGESWRPGTVAEVRGDTVVVDVQGKGQVSVHRSVQGRDLRAANSSFRNGMTPEQVKEAYEALVKAGYSPAEAAKVVAKAYDEAAGVKIKNAHSFQNGRARAEAAIAQRLGNVSRQGEAEEKMLTQMQRDWGTDAVTRRKKLHAWFERYGWNPREAAKALKLPLTDVQRDFNILWDLR